MDKWRLRMSIKFGTNNESIRYTNGTRIFPTRGEAEFAMLTAERIMKNCGFDVEFSLVQEN